MALLAVCQRGQGGQAAERAASLPGTSEADGREISLSPAEQTPAPGRTSGAANAECCPSLCVAPCPAQKQRLKRLQHLYSAFKGLVNTINPR